MFKLFLIYRVVEETNMLKGLRKTIQILYSYGKCDIRGIHLSIITCVFMCIITHFIK